MSPFAETMLSGEYANVPFEFPTLTTCTLTVPVDEEDEDDEVLEAAESAARALPMLKADKAKVANCMLMKF